uniref:Uncharacterized protein LOC113794780 isoform X1 n=1 Tax=Dermatophagoides pteronyssinus TaxID=6956 RepID=A0A6P6Y5P6_DERPT|nr:uncharacterized protein LOC113794780 isoform X1 [Dermatophagoides pteronyssinus]
MSESEQSTIPSNSNMIQSKQTDMNESNVMICSSSKQIEMKRLEGFYRKKHAIMFLTTLIMVLSAAAFIYTLVTKDEVAKLIHQTKPEISAESAAQGLVLIMGILISFIFTYSLIGMFGAMYESYPLSLTFLILNLIGLVATASMASYTTFFHTLLSLIIDVLLIALTYFFVQDLRDLRHLPHPRPILLESTGQS